MTITRTVLVVVILASVLVIFSLFASRSIDKKAACLDCNVILISIDTLGAKHTSVHDLQLETTPFLKRYADERGVVFENAYAQAPWTLPSHTAMLTGYYPWDIGIWGAYEMLPEQLDTLAERFSEQGYKTALFSNGPFVQPDWNFDQGFEETHGSYAQKDWNDVPEVFDEALQWVSSRDTSKPFFLMVRSFHVHDPYGEPEKGHLDIHDVVEVNTKPGGPTAEDARRFVTAYRNEIRTLDSKLETFFQALEAEGLLGNTVVLLTSDHGEEFGEHGTVGFHSVALYNESIHVPFILFLPGVTPKRISSTVEVRSTYATLLESVGIKASKEVAKSLLPFLSGDETTDRVAEARTRFERDQHLSVIEAGYEVLENIQGKVAEPVKKPFYEEPYTSAVIKGPYKVIKHRNDGREIFDLKADPNETYSLYNTSAAIPESARARIAELLTELIR